MLFGTKSETLENLRNLVKKSKILPQIRFTIYEWKNKKKEIIKRLENLEWSSKPLIVRSSAINEDTEQSSMAGKFLSVDNILISEVENAINNVIDAFEDEDDKNQVFIQPMLESVKICGVVFTCDPNNGGNYYIINYDDSGSTSSITSGKSMDSKVFYSFKSSKKNKDGLLEKVIDSIKEIEEIFDKGNLDIEFAVNSNNDIYIFQVRPLIVKNKNKDIERQKNILKRIEEKIKKINRRQPHLYGNNTIFGVMPDWNPAEIIGIHPRNLALSLYKEVITDNVWAYQRDNYGYLNLRSCPLLIDFAGMPYIDVRASFNSFIPKGLSEELSEKLVNYYLERLRQDPSKHDKVEFDIIFSCYTFDLPERIEILKEYGFSNYEIQEIIENLRQLTNGIINSKMGLWKKDSDKIKILEEKRKKVIESDIDDIDKIYWLLEYCKRYGTLPFAGLARAGFIAVQMLKSLVNINLLSDTEYNDFMESLDTISSAVTNDFKIMSKEGFLKKYGHLRPGTYDIKSKRYDEAPDIYFNWDNRANNMENQKQSFRMSLKQLKSIKEILIEHGIENDVLLYFDFIKEAIEGREYSKFVFTKCISDILLLMKKVGTKYELDEDDISFVDISIIKKMYSSELSEKKLLVQSIVEGKERYNDSLSIIMPPIIFSSNDIYNFTLMDSIPTYITLKRVEGEICSDLTEIDKLDNSILLISAADPGYDWIFSHKIKGFITEYGGANSHMAIRASEMQIPAVIGIGEKMFNKLIESKYIEIDASAKKVVILK